MFEIAIIVSYLFFNKKHAKRIIKFSDCLEVDTEHLILNLKMKIISC